MTTARTIEEYVEEIVEHVSEAEYEQLDEIHITLQKMKYSSKKKHELNYWRVMQCLGEVAVDTLTHYLVKYDKISCKCHMYSNLLYVMKIFVESFSNVAVIKRVLCTKSKLCPVYFKTIRQSDEPPLQALGLISMYRLLIVGKTEVAEIYLKYGLLKDLYTHVKLRLDTEQFSFLAINSVLCCSKILLAMTECGTDSMRKQIGRSTAVRILGEYIVKLRKSRVIKVGVAELSENFTELRDIISDDKLAEIAFENWKTKEKLARDVEQENISAFCSSPACRKVYNEGDKFRYCGACKLARYCSEVCQKDHWKKAHKDACLREPKEFK